MRTLSFIVPIKNEFERLPNVLSSIRLNYPDERVVIYSNDTLNCNISSIMICASSFNTETFFTTKIYDYEAPAKCYRDFFTIFYQLTTDYFIKLDTDSIVHKKIGSLDGFENNIFGCVHYASGANPDSNKIFKSANLNHAFMVLTIPDYVNGVIGFPKSVIDKFTELGTFNVENDLSFKERYMQNRSTDDLLSSDVPSKVPLSLDHIFMLGCKDAGIELKDHPEIYSVTWVGRNDVYMGVEFLDIDQCDLEINNSEKYAFTHPVNRKPIN